MFPNDGAGAEALLTNAEAALNKAKFNAERYLFYTATMTGRIAERLPLENKLRAALEKDQFVLHYQPKVDFCERRILGVAALIRWHSPNLDSSRQ
jgi:predicted signal transduction protein with EAL and GGDEF domain